MHDENDPFESILGISPAAHAIRTFGRRAASVDAPVLITGESGTGKGLLARAIHEASARARGPFVGVNCAGVPESLFESEFFGHNRGAFTGAQQSHRGLLEQSHNGTLLLDEIGELAPPMQAKLLTALEEGEFRRVGGERVVRVDLRMIAATSVDLHLAVRTSRFRADLFHRLLVLAYRLPPLRERAGDLDLFLEHMLARFTAKYDRPVPAIDDDVIDQLRSARWPGNIRQLAHTIEAAILACDGNRMRIRHLPDALFDSRLDPAHAASAPATPTEGPLPQATNRIRPAPTGRYSFFGTREEEMRVIQATLRRCRGNKTRAAAELGMARNTLRAKLRELEAGARIGH